MIRTPHALGAAALLLVGHALSSSLPARRSSEVALSPAARIAPESITLQLGDLPRGFVVDHANTGRVGWRDLAKLATKRRIALLRHNGLIAEYGAAFYQIGVWRGQSIDFIGVRTVATTFTSVSGATRVFDDPENPALSLTRWMKPVESGQREADEWQELAHTDHAGHTTIVVRWRAGSITGGLVLFGPNSRATHAYANSLALIGLRRAVSSEIRPGSFDLTRSRGHKRGRELVAFATIPRCEAKSHEFDRCFASAVRMISAQRRA